MSPDQTPQTHQLLVDLPLRRGVAAVEKLPALEELELTLGCWDDTRKTVEAIGRKCPSLKAFKLNSDEFRAFDAFCDYKDDRSFNEEAVAIGRNMTELKSLQIIGNSLTNRGLGAILDGCPELESLDLREFLNVCLEGKVWDRCVKRVKWLCLPRDSTEDYPYRTSPEDRVCGSGSCFDSDSYDGEGSCDYLDHVHDYDNDFDDDPFDYDDFTAPHAFL